MEAEQLLRSGRVSEALKELQNQVRAKPADAKSRIFLFQLLCVLGQWDRAMTQLNVCADLDGDSALMAQTYGHALRCEQLRAKVFAGAKTPLVFGEPAEWVGLMVQANQLTGQGRHEQAAPLRDQALERAPATPGVVDGAPFEWIADADSRLGPILEAIIDGKYYWVPFSCVSLIHIEEPTDLRDLVWAPAQFVWPNGGEKFGLIPVRYPGSEASEDDAVRMSRRTDWTERAGGAYLGLGQRMLTTDAEEYSLLQVRRIQFDTEEEGGGAAPAPEQGD